MRIRLFGFPRLERNGEMLSIPRRKSAALLAYLAETHSSHSRDALATLLWPENDQSGARANLRRELYRLKRFLGDEWLVLEGERVGLNTQLELWVDTNEFRDRVAAVREHGPAAHGQAGSQACAGCLESLNQAVDLYRQDFLAGFSLPDSAAFEEWRFFQVDGLRRLLEGALQQLVQWRSAAGEFDAGIEAARRWLALDPLHEPAHRQLMQLYAWSGQQAAALRQYQECARLLQEELGVEPEEETCALYLAIQARRLSPPPRAGQAGTPAGAGRPGPPGQQAGASGEFYSAELEQEIRFCTSQDGVRIAYATTGHGPPFVKVANWLSHLEFDWNSPVWRHWIEDLSKNYTLVRYDERGCGLSDWNAGEFSLEAYVRDLESVVEALGLARFPLLGVSHGGAVAVAYAVRHPERVSHLILYGAYGGRRRYERTPEALERLETMLKMIELGWGQENPAFRQIYTTLFIPEGTPEQISWFNDLQRISTAPAIAARLQESFYNIYVRDLAPQVRVPTTVLHAREDAVVAFEEGRQLAALIPGARFIPLEGKNHILLAGEPAWGRFLSEVNRFLGIKENQGPWPGEVVG